MKNSDYRVIRIRELEVFAYHGVYSEETENGQKFYINAELELETGKGDVLSDEIKDTVNYADICVFLTEFMKENTCKLLERITELLCRELLIRFTMLKSVEVEVRKPEAPIDLPFESISVVRKLSRHTAYLSIGSNMGDKQEHFDRALAALDSKDHTRLICESERLVTEPYGYTDQDNFINSAVIVETILSPHQLLDFLHEIENDEGRERRIHWGPRTLDIDIIFYDDLVMSDSTLTIPHVDMQNRFFVLEPLAKIAGYYRHPIFNETVSELLDYLRDNEENAVEE